MENKILKTQLIEWEKLEPFQPEDLKKITPKKLEKLKTSLKSNGLKTPFYVWEHKGVIYCLDGHQRLPVLKLLRDEGEKIPVKLPVIFIDCKNKKEAKKAIMLFNSHYADMQKDVLAEWIIDFEANELNMEMDIDGITDFNIEPDDHYMDKRDYENLKKSYYPSSNKYGIPDIKKQDIDIEDLIGFNYVLTSKDGYSNTVHFFLDDYQFFRVWNTPSKYINKLKKFNGMFSPDFSLYNDFPLSLQIYNTYRNRWTACYFQENDIKVIPTVGWSDESSYDFCFLGVPKSSHVAVSTVGIMKDEDAISLFLKGYQEMIKRIEPKMIYVYGSEIKGCTGNIKYFEQRRFA